MARNAPAQQKEGNLPLMRRFSLRISECRSNPRPWTGGVPVPPGLWGKNSFNSPETFGYSSLISARASTMAHKQTSREYHLLSAGTTYHGASREEVWRIISSYAFWYWSQQFRVHEYPLQKTSNFCPEYPAVPKGVFSVPLGKG